MEVSHGTRVVKLCMLHDANYICSIAYEILSDPTVSRTQDL